MGLLSTVESLCTYEINFYLLWAVELIFYDDHKRFDGSDFILSFVMAFRRAGTCGNPLVEIKACRLLPLCGEEERTGSAAEFRAAVKDEEGKVYCWAVQVHTCDCVCVVSV